MPHKDVQLILFFHEPGAGGDCVLKILDGATLHGKKLRTTHDFTVNDEGRATPKLRDEYSALIQNTDTVQEHSQVGKDMEVIRRWLNHALSKNEILVLRLCEDWQVVVDIQKAIKETFTITMQVPTNMHQCAMKNRHKVLSDYAYFGDETFEKLKAVDKKKALGFLYTKMLASGEGVVFDDKVTNYEQVDYFCSIEHLYTDRFVEQLTTDLDIDIHNEAKKFHTAWLGQQSPLYKFKLSDDERFKKCFGYNSKSKHSDRSFELDWIDKSFLLYYQKSNNLPIDAGIGTTKDTIAYLESAK
tara:strand:- start:2549 stop:3448 length:900 start_codon:yes stop_codon:yes gene_type:complete